jgi:transcription-repair coupling factor (superfamily II helicase)
MLTDSGPITTIVPPMPLMSSSTKLHSILTPPAPTGPGDKIQWGNLYGSALAAAVANAAKAHDSVTLVIVPDTASVDRLERDIGLFLEGVEQAPEVLRFADWETLPYDTFSPHQDIISQRMRALYQLTLGRKSILIAAAQTLCQKIAPKSYIVANSLLLRVGERLELTGLRSQLVAAGYQSVDTVFQHGEFAVRGALLDIFPMGSEQAYRIELFDDEIESLREFDPETQRTIRQVNEIELLPAKECPLDKAAVAHFKNQWVSLFQGDAKSCPVYQDVSSGLSPAGIEYYLPLFFPESASLFEYLPASALTVVIGGLEDAIETFWRSAHNRFESRQGDRLRPILPPGQLFWAANEIFSRLKPLARISVREQPIEERPGHYNFASQPLPNLQINAKNPNPLLALEAFLCEQDLRVLFCAESSGRREALQEQLAKIGVKPKGVANIGQFLSSTERSAITVAALDQGLIDPLNQVAVIAEGQLYGQRIQQQRRRKKAGNDDPDSIIKNLTELKIGAPVVHEDNGVGRYRGLQCLQVDGQEHEFLLIEYADQAKLYVPVANLHLISRYTGADEDHAPLHRLGSDQWQRAKRKAAEQIRDVAAELLEIYAKREARQGFAFKDPDTAYDEFAASFPFEETPDQLNAIEAVKADMMRRQPMDRLVCGDVGFGKTEVAMRAAFIAVQNGKQVVVLVPTTLLAQQHFENFKDRFADWPVHIESISRFKTAKEVEQIQKRVEEGKIDILIGTHKLLQGSLKYPNLGLLIVDEEHRFGVRQKEALKALRAEVDILTMTATPIPRTLNMAMNGIRDLSIIATPPAKRLSIKTFVREFDLAVVKEAILREILRGGQVYYLHNEVKTIDKTARELAEAIPEARIQVGHGQMRERELESVMSDFYHKRFNVLVCTTIIETGIDVPSANTIIIERADKFGLAQLHQLRGRVGRSHHQAYAYLLTANAKVMTDDAHKRLTAIAEAQDLGAGFMLASHDLEIRGAGELLGEEQSGQMQAIGFSLYMDMLERAVKAMRKGEIIDLDQPVHGGIEINLRLPALIPDDYLADVHTRLILYKRIASVKNSEELDELQVEMIDRFGLLPDATKNLMRVTRMKLFAAQLGITKVEANKEFGRIEFGSKTTVDPLTIVKLVQTRPQRYRLEGATHLKFFADMEDPNERIQQTYTALEALAGKQA